MKPCVQTVGTRMKLPMVAASELDNITKVCVCVLLNMCKSNMPAPGDLSSCVVQACSCFSTHGRTSSLLGTRLSCFCFRQRRGALPAPNPHKAKNCFTSRAFRVPSLRKTAPREATCTRFDRPGRPIWYSTGINSGYRNHTFHQLGFEWGVANFAKKVFRCFSGEPFMTG